MKKLNKDELIKSAGIFCKKKAESIVRNFSVLQTERQLVLLLSICLKVTCLSIMKWR